MVEMDFIFALMFSILAVVTEDKVSKILYAICVIIWLFVGCVDAAKLF